MSPGSVGRCFRPKRQSGIREVAPAPIGFNTPDGDVAPTRRAVELRWAAVYLTDGDTLKSQHLFFDQIDLLGQLRLLPG
jgi:hypothetical protein